ncbi:Mu transposase-like protein [Nonomuraea polychroma]|uniref:Mu transposase-like protein n=1 Tax=Nonomuraea polychroma TaxID=46176 RepID=A0A438MIY3_9ACTN|nr:Mu transposase C-terminal domain-containing protein [Nonomuraea polychroma]RVX45787.1 Mu transposase-like protein [Nonomuraea polychroma]
MADLADLADLAELSKLFVAWVETSYRQQIHSETGAKPLARWQQGLPGPLVVPSPAQPAEAFLWTERRKASKVGTVTLHHNAYEVGHELAGRYVEPAFDPFDLTRIEVRVNGKPVAAARAFTIGRHAHPKARPELRGDTDTSPPAPLTSIDYLRLVDAETKLDRIEEVTSQPQTPIGLDAGGRRRRPAAAIAQPVPKPSHPQRSSRSYPVLEWMSRERFDRNVPAWV